MKSLFPFLLITGVLGFTVGCSKVNPEVSALNSFLASTSIPTASFSVAASSLSATNSGPYDITVQLSSPALVPVTVNATASGTAASGTNYTGSFSVVIPVGSTSGVFSVTTLDTLEYAGSTDLVLTLSGVVGAALGSPSVQTVTIYKDHIGSFSITGVTGGTDSTSDAFLNTTLVPSINWGSSNGASSYDATIFAADGTTVVCGTQNIAAPSNGFTFSGCSLTAGNSYKAKITAKTSSGTNSVGATNNLYDFLVNLPPTAGVFATADVASNGTLPLTLLSGGAPAASCGVPGCTLSIQSVGTGTIGTTSLSSNTITYTPTGTLGTDSLTYVLADGRGGTTTGTINIKVRSPFTWSGLGGSSSWSLAGNWLGGVVPSTADDAVFDDFCVTNCSPNISSSASVKGLSMTPSYTGTITQNATLGIGSTGFTISGGTFVGGSAALNITGGSFYQAGGTFTGGTASIVINGSFTQMAGTLTSTTGTMTVVGNFSASGGTFGANNGTINLTNGTSLNLGGRVYKNLTFGGTSLTKTISGGNPIINGTLNFACSSCAYNGSNFLSYGNVTSSSVGISTGSSVVVVSGNAGGQTISTTGSGTIPNLAISAGTNPVTFGSLLAVAGNYFYTSAGTFITTGNTLTFGTSAPTVLFPTIAVGTGNYNNVVFTGPASVDLSGSTMQILGSLTLTNLLSGSRLNNGALNVFGNALATNSYATGNAIVRLVGSISQTLSTTSGFFPNLEIASTGGSVLFTSNVQVGGDYIYTSGSVSPSYPLLLGVTGVTAGQITNLSPYVIPGPITYAAGVQIASVGAQAFNLNGGTLYTSSLTINGTTGMALNAGQIFASGNVTIANLTAVSSASLTMNGSSAALLTTSGTVNLSAINIAKTSSTVTLANSLTFAGATQTMAISGGTLDMSGYNLTLKALTMGSTTTINKNAGLLTVNGSPISIGAYDSGYINF